MASRTRTSSLTGCGIAIALMGAAAVAAPEQEAARTPLGIGTARVTLSGTSNIHAYSASTTVVKVTRAAVAAGVAGPDFWESIQKPGGLDAFEISIPAASLSSPKEGLDKNMHKALKVKDHPDITFRLARLEPGAAGTLKGIGTLRIAGVEREVTLNLKTRRDGATLAVTGETALLMTDYGITPPKAMLGMLKTDPKVTVTFETLLTVPLT